MSRLRSSLRDQAVLVGIAVLLAALAAAVAVRKVWTFDEMENLHAAWLLAGGAVPYRDFAQSHAPLLYALLAPVGAVGSVAAFTAARLVQWTTLLATVGTSAWIAERLQPRSGAMAAILLLSCTPLVQHGVEIRPDVPLALFLTAGVAARFADGDRGPALQGLFVGLALVTHTAKAGPTALAFGALWMWDAARARSFRPLGVSILGSAAPLGLTALALAVSGALVPAVDAVVLDALRDAAGRYTHPEHIELPVRGPYLFLLVGRNPFTVPLAVVATGAALLLGIRTEVDRQWAEAGWVGLSLLGTAAINGYLFPYAFVSVLPVPVALLAAFVVRWTARFEAQVYALPVVAALFATLPTQFIVHLARPGQQDAQRDLIDVVHAVAGPEDPVYDGIGFYFRPDAAELYVMASGYAVAHYNGRFPRLVDDFRERGLVVWTVNRYTLNLSGEDLAFLRERTVQVHGPVFALGRRVDGLGPGTELSFEVLSTQPFRYEGDGELLVDGRPFAAGVLDEGEHVLAAAASIERGRLVLDNEATRVPDPYPPMRFDLSCHERGLTLPECTDYAAFRPATFQ